MACVVDGKVSDVLTADLSCRHLAVRDSKSGMEATGFSGDKHCVFVFFFFFVVFFFKQKTAYEIRNCDWSSDVCSSDLDRVEF